MGGELILNPAGSTLYLGRIGCSSVDGEAAGATAKPHHSVY